MSALSRGPPRRESRKVQLPPSQSHRASRVLRRLSQHMVDVEALRSHRSRQPDRRPIAWSPANAGAKAMCGLPAPNVTTRTNRSKPIPQPTTKSVCNATLSSDAKPAVARSPGRSRPVAVKNCTSCHMREIRCPKSTTSSPITEFVSRAPVKRFLNYLISGWLPLPGAFDNGDVAIDRQLGESFLRSARLRPFHLNPVDLGLPSQAQNHSRIMRRKESCRPQPSSANASDFLPG